MNNNGNKPNTSASNTKTQPPDQKFVVSDEKDKDLVVSSNPSDNGNIVLEADQVIFRSLDVMVPPSLLGQASNRMYENAFGLGNKGASVMQTSNFGNKGLSIFDEPIEFSAPVKGAAADYEQQLQELYSVVPELPSYFEKYTSFDSPRFPVEILRKLLEILERYSTVDFELLAEQYQIVGTVYENHASCNFRVNLFKKGRNNKVEFQRRSGDSLLFNSFFRYVKSQCADIMEDPSIAEAAAAPLTKFAAPDYDIVLDADSLAPLQSMADSMYVDVCREGMKMLAKCSSTAANHDVLSKLNEIFLKNLSIKDEEVSRYAAFCLANLSKTNAVCQKLTDPKILALICDQLEKSDNKEFSRQLAQVVANISGVNAPVLKAHARLLRKLLNSSTDAKFTSLIQSTLARVEL